jgi:hypothetical protein
MIKLCILALLMFCWPCVVVYQYSTTNIMHILFNLLRIEGLYMFRALLAHIQEAQHKQKLGILCACYFSWLHTPILVQPADITHTQYMKCRLCSVFWRWPSNARIMYKPLILNKLNKKCITLVVLHWYIGFISSAVVKICMLKGVTITDEGIFFLPVILISQHNKF